MCSLILTDPCRDTVILIVVEEPIKSDFINRILLNQYGTETKFLGQLEILYAGLLSSGVAYTFQIIAQKDADPTSATLIMSLESVFAALSGWLVLGETLSNRELAGCLLVFIAVILAQVQLPLPKKKNTN